MLNVGKGLLRNRYFNCCQSSALFIVPMYNIMLQVNRNELGKRVVLYRLIWCLHFPPPSSLPLFPVCCHPSHILSLSAYPTLTVYYPLPLLYYNGCRVVWGESSVMDTDSSLDIVPGTPDAVGTLTLKPRRLHHAVSPTRLVTHQHFYTF